MAIALVPIDPSSAPVLARLMQLYAYDFSPMMDLDVTDDGTFAAPDVAKYFAAKRHPFFVVVDERIAGFAIVDESSRLGTTDAPHDVAEFFVLRRYRRGGVGRAAAVQVFDRFRGMWEVRQVVKNAPATAFWRSVIQQYTAGVFEDFACDDERWRGRVQRFDNRDER